ncbi:MAG: PIN domain-containing protein [Syntrophales bacterium]|nr:PIN domain-containing protein [Syntrophales bacterium]MCK9527588.1 PIN domain-containing protein [Syntrophales bacterium]MDX9922205.1 PIN domain-containing protein [Syntrophales bacterium]
MLNIILRSLFIVTCSILGYFALNIYYDFPVSLTGFLIGAWVAIMVLTIEKTLRDVPLVVILGGVAGLALGIAIAYFSVRGLRNISLEGHHDYIPWRYIDIFLFVALGYMGLSLGSKKGRELSLHGRHNPSYGDSGKSWKILDTSVIVDGRFADICDTGFVEGPLTIPRFVLDELQLIADSSDSIKRARGRRGLEVLNRMKSSSGISIEISDIDFPKLKSVDAKLVALAKKSDGVVVTNDYNLNKIAELQGIRVLNVNDLANALKPLVLPGESMVVKVIKEGKEPGQGVAYLDDGTMVIVDGGLRRMKHNVDVIVTSVLQTTAGRMIFSAVKDNETSES